MQVICWAGVLALMLCGAGEQSMQEPNANQVYTVKKAVLRPEGKGLWDGPAWRQADTLDIAHFHPQSSAHRPKVQARILYDDAGLYVIFDVQDRYVVCTHTEYQSSVCRDSCAEFFVQPAAGKGYFNFEINCGGALLLTYITTPNPESGEHRQTTDIPWELGKQVRIFHSLPEKVEPECGDATEWRIEYFIPYVVFEPYVGPLGAPAGATWRANLYKCADDSSHPHWASWAPIGEKLSFHKPFYFGSLRFEK
jgi:hypothetical protein